MHFSVYTYKGNKYRIIRDDFEIKTPASFIYRTKEFLHKNVPFARHPFSEFAESGKWWYEGVLYQDIETKKICAREKEDFLKKFKPVIDQE